MAKKRQRDQTVYGTKQVAEILGIPQWRVKNFSEGEAYRLPPSQSVGVGHGSRRLYDAPDIMRLAIANELLKYGFSPDAVGRAVREIPESKLSPRSDEEEEPEKFPLLVCIRGDWEIWKMHEVDDFLQEAIKGGDPELSGIFLLDFQREVNAVEMKMAARTETAAKGPKTSGGPR